MTAPTILKAWRDAAIPAAMTALVIGAGLAFAFS